MKFIRQHWLIITIWIIGLFLRCYRQSALLPFYYDQGRDAKMAWDIVSGHHFPSIGPTTGIAGLYLGPFWYYLITPGYFFGNGNPVVASYFISFLESLVIPAIYFLLKRHWNQKAAIIASIAWMGSRYLVSSDRWFSNPTPIPLFAVLIMILCLEIIKDKKHGLLPLLLLFLGLSLQLEAASAIFFFPIVTVFFIINRRQVKKIKLSNWLKSAVSFGILLLPQLAFDIKNNFLITKNLLGFLTGKVNSASGKSWAIPSMKFIIDRLQLYYQYYFTKIDTNLTLFSIPIMIVFVVGLVYLVVKFRHQLFIQLLLIWFLVPSLMLLFFVGNYGRLYDYYITGFYPAFIMLIGIIFSSQTILSVIFVVYFVNGNYIHLKNYLSAGIDGPDHVTYGNTYESVKTVCQLTQNQNYSVEIYVPPITPHPYEYLFYYLNRLHQCQIPSIARQKDMFLIYEVDTNNPQSLIKWQNRFSQAKIIDTYPIGGVTVEKRLNEQ